jgi:hypothetical protein
MRQVEDLRHRRRPLPIHRFERDVVAGLYALGSDLLRLGCDVDGRVPHVHGPHEQRQWTGELTGGITLRIEDLILNGSAY